MMVSILLALLAADGGTTVPPMLKRPEEVWSPRYRFVPWEKGGVPEQLEAPCPQVRSIWTVNGKCWGMTTDKPPCPRETWEDRGGCYIPVVAEEAPPPRA